MAAKRASAAPWWQIARLFVPERCAACGDALPTGSRLLCPSCSWELPLTGFAQSHENPLYEKLSDFLPVVEASAWIYFDAGNAYQTMIHNLKYRGAWRTALELGRMMGEELRTSGRYDTVDWVVPMPLHYRRLMQRGYNQSLYLAQGIAEQLGKPLNDRILRRSLYNPAQARIRSRAERWENVQGIFSLHPQKREIASDHHILLVDDLFTSGATIISCAEALLRSAPRSRISLVTLAVSNSELHARRTQGSR